MLKHGKLKEFVLGFLFVVVFVCLFFALFCFVFVFAFLIVLFLLLFCLIFFFFFFVFGFALFCLFLFVCLFVLFLVLGYRSSYTMHCGKYFMKWNISVLRNTAELTIRKKMIASPSYLQQWEVKKYHD